MPRRKKIVYYPIFPNPGDPGSERADFVRNWVDKFLLPNGMATDNEEEATAYLVASGDGGMTKAARNHCDNTKVHIGVNCGTLGFLMNQLCRLDELPVFESDLNKVTVQLMQGTFICRDGSEHTYLAFNDIFCGGNIADFVTFHVKGSMSHFRDRKVQGNGIFISTPQGTTGFALNARGSSAVLPLDTNTWYIGGVATGPYPNNVFTPQRVEIEVESRRPVNAYADGYEQEAIDVKKIIVEPTKHHVTLGFVKNVDFESRRRDLAHRIEVGLEPGV